MYDLIGHPPQTPPVSPNPELSASGGRFVPYGRPGGA